MRTLAILVSIILISSVLLIIPDATAQQSARRMLAIMEAQGQFGCEVWIINDFLYKPVRINLTHEEANQKVQIDSEDPEAKVFWDGSPETFQLVTKSNGRHTIELNLDYMIEHEEPRQVFYQVFAKDNTLMMEGNWVHDGQSFCKVIDFFTNQAPEEITPEQIQEENNKFNADFRKDTSLKFTTIETALLILLIVISIVGITSTMYCLCSTASELLSIACCFL